MKPVHMNALSTSCTSSSARPKGATARVRLEWLQLPSKAPLGKHDRCYRLCILHILLSQPEGSHSPCQVGVAARDQCISITGVTASLADKARLKRQASSEKQETGATCCRIQHQLRMGSVTMMYYGVNAASCTSFSASPQGATARVMLEWLPLTTRHP